MSETPKHYDADELLQKLADAASNTEGLLYSRRKMLRDAIQEIEELRVLLKAERGVSEVYKQAMADLARP